MIFKTKRLVLRPWKDEDAKWLYFYARNPHVGPKAGWEPHKSREESLHIIRNEFSKPETYAITLKGRPIGCINLYLYPDGNYYWGEGNAELGYWIGEPHWDHGIASEAGKKLIEHGFKDLKLNNIFALYQNKNKKSKQVLKKLGFKYYDDVQRLDSKNKPFKEVAMCLSAEDYFNKNKK